MHIISIVFNLLVWYQLHFVINLTYYFKIHIDVPDFNHKSRSPGVEVIGNSAIIDNRSDDSYKGIRQQSPWLILDSGIQNTEQMGRGWELGESDEEGCSFPLENKAPSNCKPVIFAWLGKLWASLDHEQDKWRQFNGYPDFLQCKQLSYRTIN